MAFEKELEAARGRLAIQEKELENVTFSYKLALEKNMPATAKVTGAKMKRYEFAVALSREAVKELELATRQLDLPIEGAVKRKTS